MWISQREMENREDDEIWTKLNNLNINSEEDNFANELENQIQNSVRYYPLLRRAK